MSTSPSPGPSRLWLREGAIVAGAYVVDHILGEGSSGEVWAATDSSSGAQVALKVLVPGASSDRELAERFRREAYFLARTASDHVARIHDFVCDPDVGMVLVMELVDGESLACLLERQTLSVEEAIELGVDLLDGVQVLHAARVIHRDLKPGNIIMRPGPDGRTRPVICDFGLSRLARRREDESLSGPSLTALTKGDVAMGTVKYMAPEQVLNASQATEQSDLYAVGAILHRAVTGAPPFGEHTSPSDIARAKVMGDAPPMDSGRSDPLARALERVVTQALRRRPAERPRDAAAMRAELGRLVELARVSITEGETQKTLPPLDAARAGPSEAKRRGASPLVLVVGVLVIFAGGVATGRVWTREAPAESAVPAAASTVTAIAEVRSPPLAPTPVIDLPELPAEVASVAPTAAPVHASAAQSAPVLVSPPAALSSPSAAPASASAQPRVAPPPRPQPEDDNPY